MFVRILAAFVTADWIDRRMGRRDQRRMAQGRPRRTSIWKRSPALWLIRRIFNLFRPRRRSQ